jgi:hypothetical protein
MSFICSVCKKSFASRQRLDYHTSRNVCVSNEEENKCMMCDNFFSSKQKLEYHTKNTVCKKPDDMASKMFEMFDIIKKLEERVSYLENDNTFLKERIKALESDKIKNKESEEEASYKRMHSFHIKSIKVDDNKKLYFTDDIHRYSVIVVQKDKERKPVIWSRIDSNDNYKPLTKEDIINIHSIFKMFGLLPDNEKITINTNIYDKCVSKLGTKFRNFNTNNNQETNEETKETNEETNIHKVKEDFFIKNEEGTYYFINSTIKKGSMEVYKHIYNTSGEIALFNEAPQRFLNLWENSTDKERILRFFNN